MCSLGSGPVYILVQEDCTVFIKLKGCRLLTVSPLSFFQLEEAAGSPVVQRSLLKTDLHCLCLFSPTPSILKWISFELKVHKFSLSSDKGIVGRKNDLNENHLFFSSYRCRANFLLEKKVINILGNIGI